MKISTRLSAGFGLLILLFIICTGTAIHALDSARDGMDEVVNVRLKKYQTVLDMRGGVRDMAIAVRNLALLTDPVAMKPEWERLQKQRALYISNREVLSGMMQTDSGQAGREAMSRIESTEEAALSTLMTAGKLGMENRQQEVTDYLLKVARPAQQSLLKAINDLTELEMRSSRDAVVDNGIAIARTTWILIILAVLSVLAAVVTCAFIVRILMRQLGGEPVQAQTLAAAIAAGDLTSPVTVATAPACLRRSAACRPTCANWLRRSKGHPPRWRWRPMRFRRAIPSFHPVPSSRLLRCRKRPPAWSSSPPR
jgi:methyl-accepting chemotaxis protein